MNWQSFWNTYPKRSGPNTLLWQVGKTVSGVPISAAQLETIVCDVCTALNLSEGDRVLDLCCGNGLLTREIARRCRGVMGIDFSEPLIERARAQCQAPNVEYRLLDVRQVDSLRTQFTGAFDKVVMYEALAYFHNAEAAGILRSVGFLLKPGGRVFLASVLDSARKWRFFNTWRRRWTYLWSIKLLGQDPGLGKWWSRRELEQLSATAGYSCTFYEQSSSLHTAHYRIDVLLTPIRSEDQAVHNSGGYAPGVPGRAEGCAW